MGVGVAKQALVITIVTCAIIAANQVFNHIDSLISHNFLEMNTVAINISIFIITIYTKHYSSDTWLQPFGIMSLGVAVNCIFHLLFISSDVTYQLTMLGRYLETASFLTIIGAMQQRRFSYSRFFAVAMLTGALAHLSILSWQQISLSFLWTISPFVTTVVDLMVLYYLLIGRNGLRDTSTLWLIIGLSCTVITGCLSLSPTSILKNAVLIHSLRLISYTAIFQAVILVGVRRPLTTMTRDLHENEIARLRIDAAYRQIVETTQEGVWVLDLQGRTTYVNQQMADMLGLAIEDVLGHNPQEFIYEVVESDSSSPRYDAKLKQNSGREIWVSIASNVMRDYKGHPIGTFSLVSDITSHKKTEEELTNLSASKDHMISIISHELKTPLTVMLANLQMLSTRRNSLSEEKQEHMLDSLVAQSKKLNRLVNDLLDMSRVISGQLVLNKKLVDLSSLVIGTTSDNQAIHKTHIIEYEAQDNVLSIADSDRIEQVLANLISNATRYSPSGSTVTVSLTAVGDEARISVTDQGQGIAPEEMPNLFDRYYRSSKAREGVSAGMGVGLYVCKEIVDRHGGSISVTSRLGLGSTFLIILPLYKSSAIKTADSTTPDPSALETTMVTA